MKQKLLLSLFVLLTAATVWAETAETFYLDKNGTRHDVSATVLDGGAATSLDAGWYVVKS